METDRSPGNAGGHEPDAQPSLGAAIDGLLGRLPPELARGIRLGAIPHRFDADLLALLLGDGANAGPVTHEMRRLHLLRETAPGRLAYHDHVRSHLLAGLQNQPEIYRQASARAAEYYRARWARQRTPDARGDLLECVYHRLAADEATGLLELRGAFDGFIRAAEFGLAERLLDYAGEQQAVLSQRGQHWLRALGAQLRQAGPQQEAGESIFGELASEAGDPLLRAVARRSLAELLAQQWQWASSLDELQAALRAFGELGDEREIANTQATLGLVFVGLAEAAGGLWEELPMPESPAARWLHGLEHAPFLAYRWLSRRLSFVPILYFGTDYQNWIIVRYLHAAIRWFARAAWTLARVEAGGADARSIARTQLEIRLADLRHRVGRWSRAERAFATLAQDANVRGSPYLLALVQLGRGRALVARGRLEPALEDLRECADTFRRYGDLGNAGKADKLIGQACTRRGDLREAGRAYRAAAESLYGTGDLLSGTEAVAAAYTLAERLPADEAERLRAELSGQFSRLAYVERFPDQPAGSLHRLFRRLASILMLALGGQLIAVLILIAVLWIGVVEAYPSLVLLPLPLPILALLPTFALWAYEAVYAAVGVLVARVLPLRQISRNQPVCLVLDQQSLRRYDQHGRMGDAVRWSEVTVAASLDRRLWRTPLALFSRLLIGDVKNTVIVSGILNHYLPFKDEVSRRLRTQPLPVRTTSLDFALLDRRWLLETMAVTILLAGISIAVDPTQLAMPGIDAQGGEFSLAAAGVVFRLWVLAILVGPLFFLIELLRNRRVLRRLLGDRASLGPDWPIWLALFALLGCTVLQFLWLALT